jgi:hypothetical protein
MFPDVIVMSYYKKKSHINLYLLRNFTPQSTHEHFLPSTNMDSKCFMVILTVLNGYLNLYNEVRL